MEEMLIICGIIIFVLPKLFKDTYFGNGTQYSISTQMIGIFAFALGCGYCINKIDKGNILFYVLFLLMFIWNIMLLLRKIKNERTIMAMFMNVISVALIIIALIFIFDIDGIASSVIALTASMIALSIPYDRISVKE